MPQERSERGVGYRDLRYTKGACCDVGVRWKIRFCGKYNTKLRFTGCELQGNRGNRAGFVPKIAEDFSIRAARKSYKRTTSYRSIRAPKLPQLSPADANSGDEAAVEQSVKIADELRIKGFLDSLEKNPEPFEFRPERQLQRTKELAALLRISARSITNWRERRVIPFIKIKGVIMSDVHKVKAALERFERKEIR